MYKTQFILLLIISFLACVTLLTIAYRQSVEITNKGAQIKAITDTVTYYKTKAGKNAAYRPVFVGTEAEVLAVTKQTAPEVYKTIKSTKGLQSFIQLQTITKIDTIVRVDTIYKTGFTKQINNEYYTANISLNKDSLSLAMKLKNDFDISTHLKSNGFLKGKTLVVDVVNKNPYTVTTGISSFQIQPKKKTGLKISIGLAVGIGAYLLLK